MNQHKQPSDIDLGRGWLDRAAEMLDSCEGHRSDAEFARAAAAIGNGFIQLAAVERTTAWRAEDLARWTADREAERENDDVVRETNRLILARERGELALVEQRTSALAALDVAALAASGQREKRAEAEARPHDDEPVLGDVIKCQQCGRQTRSISRGCSACGFGKPSVAHDDEPVNLCETDADMAARFAGQIGELTSRIEDALSWFHEPDDATPEIQLAKIRAALTGESRRG